MRPLKKISKFWEYRSNFFVNIVQDLKIFGKTSWMVLSRTSENANLLHRGLLAVTLFRSSRSIKQILVNSLLTSVILELRKALYGSRWGLITQRLGGSGNRSDKYQRDSFVYEFGLYQREASFSILFKRCGCVPIETLFHLSTTDVRWCAYVREGTGYCQLGICVNVLCCVQ